MNLNVFKGGRNPFDKLKCAWQRATKGYCYRDLWALDDFYNSLFSASLMEFANTSASTPCNYTEQEWRNALQETARKFSPKDYYSPDPQQNGYKEVLEGLDWLKENWGDLWD